MTKTIWHLGAWAWNYGDRVLQIANTDILRSRCKKNLKFVYIDTQKTYFSDNLINKMNSEADLLYIGGGGLVFHRPEDNSHSGWQFNIDIGALDKIKIPMVAYGIGYNLFPNGDPVFPQKVSDHIQKTIDKCSFFSVRDEGSYEALRGHQINMDKVDIVPDAGMFVRSYPYFRKCLDNNKLKIGVNWATDRWEQRFGGIKTATKRMEFLFKLLKEIAEKYDAQIYLIDHLLHEARNKHSKSEMHKIAKNILSDRVCVMYEETKEELFPPFDYLAPLFTDIYRQMDLTLGMRGHANIIPFGQNVPCIGLGSHNKIKWFLEQIGMEKCIIPLDDQASKSEQKAKFIIEDVINNIQDYKYSMDMQRTQLEYVKDAFIDKIVSIIGD